jgi:hypothetical protein
MKLFPQSRQRYRRFPFRRPFRTTLSPPHCGQSGVAVSSSRSAASFSVSSESMAGSRHFSVKCFTSSTNIDSLFFIAVPPFSEYLFVWYLSTLFHTITTISYIGSRILTWWQGFSSYVTIFANGHD